MAKTILSTGIVRIIDANVNRAKEGLRVCEEVSRFVLTDRISTARLKGIRHAIDSAVRRMPCSIAQLLTARDSSGDIGRDIYGRELKRGGVRDIFFANIQRAKESVRVLEEFSKLTGVRAALDFKRIRYGIYEAEKRITQKLAALRNYR